MKCHPIPPNEPFFQTLRQLDQDLFLAVKAKGCPHCKGQLDTSNYYRKTRGMPQERELCFSLCCRQEGCRKRRTPRSLRFLGRRVYGAWVVILAVDFCSELGLKGKIARQTISRWKTFWRARLVESGPFMKWARGVLPPGTSPADSPAALVHCFGFPTFESWILILKFFTEPV